MENWVETTHPLNEAERNLHFIMEHRIFDFFPCRGTLQPCSSCRVTVAYKHIAPGVHILPLLLQVRGKGTGRGSPSFRMRCHGGDAITALRRDLLPCPNPPSPPGCGYR